MPNIKYDINYFNSNLSLKKLNEKTNKPILQNLPAVKSLLRSIKALECGMWMVTGALRALRQSAILEEEEKSAI